MAGTFRVSARDKGDFVTGRLAWDVLRTTAVHRQDLPDAIDLSDCEHLKPYSVACIAALGIAARRAGRNLPLVLPQNHACRDHLLRLGLTQWFAAEGQLPVRDTNIPIEHLTGRPGAFSDRAMEVWAKQMGDLPVNMRRDFATHLDELILNALGHSYSPIGCVVAGQAFPESGAVEFAVLDLGQTILGHLCQHPNHRDLVTDAQAIDRATQEAVTGTPPGGVNALNDPNSGSGLTSLRRFCELGNGCISILSGSSCVSYGGGVAGHVLPINTRFEGTLVRALFECNNQLCSSDLADIIW